MIQQRDIYRGLYFLVTMLIMVAPMLYNRYPLVYFDSGAYMEMAVGLDPSFHRSWGYPLLMRLSGWLVSNWPIVFIQGLLVSILLYRVVRSLFFEKRYIYHFLTVVILTFASSLSWYASQLMPDIFTFILVLSVIALTLEERLSLWGMLAYSLLVFLSLLTHLSHIPLLLLLLAGMAVIGWRWKMLPLQVREGRWLLLAGPLVAAFLTLSTFNALHGLGFRLSLASNVFITANLGEMGILKLYLDENCDDAPPSLCSIKDDLPLETGGYLWDPSGPVQNNGGDWAALNKEYAPVVRDFLFKPRYVKWFIIGSIKATFKQLFQIEMGSGLAYQYGENTPPYWPMQTHFKQELNEYLGSVQQKGQLPLGFFKGVNYISLFLSLLIIGWAVLTGRVDQRLLTILLIVVLAYFFHAAITGVLANVYDRLQCRLLPLIQMFAVLALLANVKLSALSRQE